MSKIAGARAGRRAGRMYGTIAGKAGKKAEAAMAGRALVLGGGGVTGVAWEFGILTGLAEAGVDLTTADLVVGTSAGAVVAVPAASGVDLEERYKAQLAGPAGAGSTAASAPGPTPTSRPGTNGSSSSRRPCRGSAR